MRHRLILLFCLVAAVPAALAGNALSGHPSPYLAMHGQDPVHWQTWHRDVIRRAAREDRLLFVSVGYFSCRWLPPDARRD